MIEDKLSHDERLCLECINQVISIQDRLNTNADQIVMQAKKFEAYVRGEEA